MSHQELQEDAAATAEIMVGSNPQNENEILCQLAVDVCKVIERGDTSELYAMLDINTNESASAMAIEVDGSAAPNSKCTELLSVFHLLIGNNKGNTGGLNIPLSIKAHLLLRALLQIPYVEYSIPW